MVDDSEVEHKFAEPFSHAAKESISELLGARSDSTRTARLELGTAVVETNNTTR